MGGLVWRETSVGQAEPPGADCLGLAFTTQKHRDLNVGVGNTSRGVDDAHHPICCGTLMLT